MGIFDPIGDVTGFIGHEFDTAFGSLPNKAPSRPSRGRKAPGRAHFVPVSAGEAARHRRARVREIAEQED